MHEEIYAVFSFHTETLMTEGTFMFFKLIVMWFRIGTNLKSILIKIVMWSTNFGTTVQGSFQQDRESTGQETINPGKSEKKGVKL